MEKESLQFEYTWQLQNYNILDPNNVLTAESPEFEIPASTKTRWVLGLYPCKSNDTQTVFLKRSSNDSGPLTVPLRYNITIKNENDTVPHVQEIETFSFKKGSSIASTFQLKNKNTLNTLILHCSFYSTEKENNFMLLGDKEDLMILSKDITSLFEDEILSDVTLMQYNQEFKAHKSIVWARYPELLQLENSDERVTTDISIQPNDMKGLLRDIYSGNLDSFKSDTLICPAVLKQELKLGGNTSSVTSLCVHSHIQEYNVSHEWSIDVNELNLKRKVLSPLLCMNAHKFSLWRLIIQLKSISGHENVEICLRCVSNESSTPVFLNCKISLSQNYEDFSTHSFHSGEDYCLPLNSQFAIYINGIISSNIYNSKISNSIILSKCILSTSNSAITTSMSHSKSQYTEMYFKNLSDDLLKLYTSQQFKDVSLVVGDAVFPAHKAILSARSPVFSRMFQANMTECLNNRIVIEDTEPEIIGLFLEYIYTGGVKIHNTDSVPSLYALADKYEVLSLRKKCGSYMESNFSFDNIGEMLILADTHQDEKFKKAAQNFIYENADKFFVTDEWKYLIEKRINLTVEIIHHLSIVYGKQNKAVKTNEFSGFSNSVSSIFGSCAVGSSVSKTTGRGLRLQ